jgi:hypothetical protein
MLSLSIKFVWYVIKIIIMQHAPYYVSLETINLVIMSVIVLDKKCASTVGAAKDVISLCVRKDVCMALAKGQVITNFCQISIENQTAENWNLKSISAGVCECRHGYNGSRCDECLTYPGCKNGFCTKPWECICIINWGGILCDNGKFLFSFLLNK